MDRLDRAAQEHLVYQAICAVAAHCDGAHAQDGIGFSGQDTAFGRRIAAIAFEAWTPQIRTEAARIISTYAAQVRRYLGVEINQLDVVAEAHGIGTLHLARQQARDAERAVTARSQRFATILGKDLHLRFPFDAALKDTIKGAGARWNGTTWWLPTKSVSTDLVSILVGAGFRYDDEVAQILDGAVDLAAVPTLSVERKGDQLLVTLNKALGRDAFNAYRGLDGYSWVRGSESSYVDITARNLAWLTEHGLSAAEAATYGALVSAEAEAREAASVASRAAESTLDLSSVVPAGLTPYGFQVAGVEYALAARRTFVADEMGLGKTIQAILATKASGAYPAVVVCPASLKGNWAREIRRWDPEASISTLSGRTPSSRALGATWTIVNYDIVEPWASEIAKASPAALVLDESHYAKNPAAKRTKALITISQAVPADGLVLCLTGTPILNRPVELVTQLKILGRLKDIAPTPRGKKDDRGYEFSFKFRYCGAHNNGYGWEFKGTSNAAELNDKLRSVCFVRRERSDVLDLTETHRTQISLSLNGRLDAYRAAERDVIAFLRALKGDKAANRARKAEALVQLNTLRRLAEEAKVEATIEWIEDWLDSYPGRKIVVFSAHKSVQDALAEHFSCPTILGGQKDVEAQKKAFQEGEARIIVCSLQAAREGHTLTAASDVVFTSLGWTPGGLQQAEDRCNRIGQSADKVIAWQLQADDTIDEDIAELIEAKRQAFRAVVIGNQDDDNDDEIVDAVIERLSGKKI